MTSPFIPTVITKKDVKRFLSKIVKTDNDGCWLWQGATNNQGYGRFYFEDGLVQAHRFSYMLQSKKRIPEGFFICHHCDVPECVKPSHLFIGTAKDNVVDMYNKNRGTDNTGINNGRAKMNKKIATKIRSEYADNKLDQYQLAEKYNISQTTIWRIVNGVSW